MQFVEITDACDTAPQRSIIPDFQTFWLSGGNGAENF